MGNQLVEPTPRLGDTRGTCETLSVLCPTSKAIGRGQAQRPGGRDWLALCEVRCELDDKGADFPAVFATLRTASLCAS